ncbi:MAG TPA: 6-phosphofructokinase [Bacteroidetes bacterium]|nr:6-phosphofructokinase [Bacteroidota bacterium]
MKKQINRIGVLTSGGDAPGMNACIRAVVRTGVYYRKEVVGICSGYDGLICGDFQELKARTVGKIIHRGGTFLKSGRSDAFMQAEGRKKAYQNLVEKGIDALITIGGNGTFYGAHLFGEEYGIPIIGIPGTINNDLNGTDYAIGFDTATNTVVEAVDQIRDTAASHGRLFFVEVMGKHSGAIAMHAGLAAGAEAIQVPENGLSTEELVRILDRNWKSSKSFSLVIVAEGETSGRSFDLAKEVGEKLDYYDIKVTILGYLQRGGRPSCLDRMLASRMGVGAVEGLLEGKKDVMTGIVCNKLVYSPLLDALKRGPATGDDLLRIASILSI